MKTTIASLLTSFAFAAAMHGADVTVKLSDVHLCCGACVAAVDKTLTDSGVKGVTAKADRTAKTIVLTGADTASVQKVTDALVAAGVFGKSDNPAIKVIADTGAKGQKVQSLKIEGVHLCCATCVSTVDEVVKKVAGVKEQDAKSKAKTFTVTGDFNDKDVFAALQKAGLTGKVAKE
jgi:copper chaperone CopZ